MWPDSQENADLVTFSHIYWNLKSKTLFFVQCIFKLIQSVLLIISIIYLGGRECKSIFQYSPLKYSEAVTGGVLDKVSS